VRGLLPPALSVLVLSSSLATIEGKAEVGSIEGGGGELDGGVGGIAELAGGFLFRFGELNCVGKPMIAEGRGFNIEG
jgi:hypothetical protein